MKFQKRNTVTKLFLTTLWLAGGLAAGFAAPAISKTSAEKDLIAVLQGDAPKGDKALACKFLAVQGTKEAVPALAPLLADKELASWSRIALEAIPDSSADAALREAMGGLQGRLLVGVINSINRRRDVQAVGGLIPKLKDADPEVVSAAAAALGQISGLPAAQALEQALTTAPVPLRTEIAEGAVICAERLLANGKATDAQKLYDAIRKASVSKQRLLEATRGAILARGTAGLPLLLEQLRSNDKGQESIGLMTARELPGQAVTEAVAAELEKAAPEKQAKLILVLSDRADPAALPTVQKAAQNGSKPLRLAAIGALDRMGNVTTVPVLLTIAAEDDADLAKAARTALARVPGKTVDAEVLKRLPGSTGRNSQVLLELAGQRQIAEALPTIATFTANADGSVRAMALAAIAAMGDEKQAPDLVKLLGQTAAAKDREEIEKALVAVCGRAGAKSVPAIQPLTQNTDTALRKTGLHALASAGGPTALGAVKNALNDADTSVQDEAVRTLSTWPNSWPDDAAVADPLLSLAKEGKKTLHQVLGARGYLQYVQGTKNLAEEAKLAKINELMPMLKRPEEKRSAMAALGNVLTPAAIEQLLTFVEDPVIGVDAATALSNLASRGDIPGASKDLRIKALKTAIPKTTDETTKRKAQKSLRGLTQQ